MKKNFRKHFLLPFLAIYFTVSSFTGFCYAKNSNSNINSKVAFVDMFMGVQGLSNCVIGPQLPHGSVNPSPQTPKGQHGGYNPKEPIRGFAQLHVSGTGWGRYGQILVSPQIGFNANEEGQIGRAHV